MIHRREKSQRTLVRGISDLSAKDEGMTPIEVIHLAYSCPNSCLRQYDMAHNEDDYVNHPKS